MIFAHIQYPIIDLRPFLIDNFKILTPLFPVPCANTWLRDFGHVRERKTDTSKYYIAENKFCEAHNAVKFVSLPHIQKDPDYDYTVLNNICKFRRFRSDGNLKSCFDIGILTDPINGFPHEELKEILVNVKSYTRRRKIEVPLFQIGKHICKLYEDSTSIKTQKVPVKTIYSGSPIVVYIDYDDVFYYENNGINVKNVKFKFGKGKIKLCCHKIDNDIFWVITPLGYHYNKYHLASIRRALLAIALEKETLIASYNFLLLNADNKYINIPEVINYIKKTQEKLLKQFRFGFQQSSLVDFLFKYDFENNKAFYNDIIKLIKQVGDKYVINDFNKLFIKLEFDEWSEKIQKLLNKNTIKNKEYRNKLIELRGICVDEDRNKFWGYIYKNNIDVHFIDILKDVFSSGIWDLIKLFLKPLL